MHTFMELEKCKQKAIMKSHISLKDSVFEEKKKWMSAVFNKLFFFDAI